MREVESTSSAQSQLTADQGAVDQGQRRFDKAAFAPEQAADFSKFRQAAYSPNLADPIVEIPTLYTNNANVETRGFYFAHSPLAQLYNQKRETQGHLMAKDQGGRIHDWATATFVSSSGLAVTDLHAVEHNNGTIDVTANGKIHTAKVIDIDRKHDLALLQVMPAAPGETFTPVHFGSSKMSPNEQVTFLGFPKSSDKLHVSPGNYLTDMRPSDIHGYPKEEGEDLSRRIEEVAANVQAGNSGGTAFRLENSDAIGISSTTDQGKLALLTPSEDVVAFIQRTQHDFPSIQQDFLLTQHNFPSTQNPIESHANFYDRFVNTMPSPLASGISWLFGAPKTTDSIWGNAEQNEYWRGKVRNFSLKQLWS
jgi:S1-C subfamily serine protease